MVRLTRVPRSAVAYMRQFVIFAPFSVTEVPLLLAMAFADAGVCRSCTAFCVVTVQLLCNARPMFGIDEALDDAHWVNVQDPIKHMFIALTKAIRSQAAGMRDLDRRCADFVTNDRAQNLIQQSFDKSCSKQDATQIIYKMDSKASERDVAVLESKLLQALGLIDKLNNSLHEQSIVLSDINLRLDRSDRDIDALKNPNYDQIFCYIDRQVANAVSDFERKLETKADVRYVDNALPERLENLYRTMNVKINDMKVDISKAATKDEFLALANQKVSCHLE
jgi:hypothetical protein